eukprot:CCRYP_017724-RA/>CCRYP_017724-RA protein AED:0.34 eAED:0.23 QI:0/0/0/1/1/1/3/0/930
MGGCVLETLESVLLSPEVPIVVSSDLVGEKIDCSAEAVKDAVECNMPRPIQEPTISVPLGVLLYPNDDRSEFDDDTKDLCSTLPPLINRSDSDDTTVTDITYRSCDTKSDDDSFMPRQKSCLKKPILSSDINKWEFLNDVPMDANITLETEDATESITSFGGKSYSNSWSVASDTGDSDDQSTTSIASAETLCTFTSEASSQLFKPLPTSETLRLVEEATIGKKAVKADDSKVPKQLWNDRIKSKVDDTTKERFLDSSRELELRVFRRALYLDCMEHLDAKFGIGWRSQEQRKGKYRLNRLGKEVDAIRNILWHARPDSKQQQPEFPDPDVKEQVRAKVLKVIRRRYMVRARTTFDIKSLIKYFAVPKGLRNIRIVYDGTASGLNDAVWSPSFWLPTFDSLVRALDASSWMTDRDIGDMFLNFQLHESAWQDAGVDIKPIMTEQEVSQGKHRWYHLVCNAMAFSPSPYNSIRMALIAEEVIRGDKEDSMNPFQWNSVCLNLPGTSSYDPMTSWIAKVREDGLVACELFTFVDDERVTGATEELTWLAAHVMAAKQAYLGIQDAARKADECSQQPRHGLGFHLTEEMWGGGNRDADGWKLPPEKTTDKMEMDDGIVIERDEDEAAAAYSMRKLLSSKTVLHAPVDGVTQPAPRLMDDLNALIKLTSSALPPLRIVRPHHVSHVFYGFGDASGKGKGSTKQSFKTIHHASGELGPAGEVKFRVGVWNASVESESSNYRELRNLVEDLEAEAASGGLTDTEMFLFTDNSTAESAYYKGSPSSKKLHALILRLHKLSLDYSLILHVVHVSGTRMIAQGTDGCSRGLLLEGVMAGQSMLSFVDLDKTAVERSPELLPWIRSWCGRRDINPLTPEQWFMEGHGIIGGHLDIHGVWMPDHEPSGNTHQWAPQPAVADVYLKRFLKPGTKEPIPHTSL